MGSFYHMFVTWCDFKFPLKSKDTKLDSDRISNKEEVRKILDRQENMQRRKRKGFFQIHASFSVLSFGFQNMIMKSGAVIWKNNHLAINKGVPEWVRSSRGWRITGCFSVWYHLWIGWHKCVCNVGVLLSNFGCSPCVTWSYFSSGLDSYKAFEVSVITG